MCPFYCLKPSVSELTGQPVSQSVKQWLTYIIWNIPYCPYGWGGQLVLPLPFCCWRVCSHNHNFDYSATVTHYLCVPVPPAFRPTLAEKWTWDLYHAHQSQCVPCAWKWHGHCILTSLYKWWLWKKWKIALHPVTSRSQTLAVLGLQSITFVRQP